MKKIILLISFLILFYSEKAFTQCNPPTQEICMVTADTIAHTYGVVVWEKVVTSEIDSFFIYRRNGLGLYDKIGATHYSAPGEFWDFSVDLAQNFSGLYRYKISTLDTCGNESLKSKYHKPIHLIYTGLGNFNYDDYEIEAITPNYFFELYIDFTGVGNTWQIINSVAPGFFDMQDPGYTSNTGAVYHVRAVLPSDCDPSRTGVNTSRSNIKNQSITNDIRELKNELVKIYPNPIQEILSLEIKPGLKIYSAEVFNMVGQSVKQIACPDNNLILNDLNSGIYTLVLHTNTGNIEKKFMKE